MAKINYSNIEKADGNFLQITKHNKYFHTGYYIGNSLTILFHCQQKDKHHPVGCTDLVCRYDGKRYQRNYDAMLSEEGIKRVCTKFQEDILTGTVVKSVTKIHS